MKNAYAEKVATLEAKHQEELAKLERESAILEALPDSLSHLDLSLHIYKLWDREATVHARFCNYETLRKGPDPALDDALTLWRAFPHAPLCLVKSEGTSIRTSTDTIHENENSVSIPIAPFWITVDPSSYSQAITLHWIARIAEKWVECDFDYRLYSLRGLGTLDLRFNYYGGQGEVASVERNIFVPSSLVTYLIDAKVEALRYASGDRKIPGRHLLYWDSGNGHHSKATLFDLISALKSAEVSK